MGASLFPLQYLIATLALWLNRQQQEVIDYLQAENRLLKAKLGDKKIHFTDAERRGLAIRAKVVGRKVLSQLETLVTPDTLLRWHRELVAQKWNFVHRRGAGRPRTKDQIAALIVRMATDNPSWGYTRILDALSNVGFKVGRGTIANVLRENSIDPAPLRRKRTQWSTFLKAHWKILGASDFYSVEVWRLSALTIIRLPPRSPNLNAYAERFVGSIKAECLSRLIFFGEASLRRARREYAMHYHHERNHQGMHNRLLNGATNDVQYLIDTTKIACRSRLGGMLNYYYREAA